MVKGNRISLIQMWHDLHWNQI